MVNFWGVMFLPLLGLGWFLIIGWRRLGVAVQSNRGIGGLKPAQAYALCHDLLNNMVKQAYYLLPQLNPFSAEPYANWLQNTVSVNGLIMLRTNQANSTALAAPIPWTEISGVGVEMAPIFNYAPATRSYWDIVTRVTLGYRFTILVVLTQGTTLTLELPLKDNEQAANFGSLVLACARFHDRRMTLIGFDKALTASIVHTRMF